MGLTHYKKGVVLWEPNANVAYFISLLLQLALTLNWWSIRRHISERDVPSIIYFNVDILVTEAISGVWRTFKINLRHPNCTMAMSNSIHPMLWCLILGTDVMGQKNLPIIAKHWVRQFFETSGARFIWNFKGRELLLNFFWKMREVFETRGCAN